mmetsp:Transcript_70850/g.179315  ORF Transcript_70850/g.179315 Transcript_70850/m.179315 type:complete len:109 (+) Transcript_70850:972-1298(+)
MEEGSALSGGKSPGRPGAGGVIKAAALEGDTSSSADDDTWTVAAGITLTRAGGAGVAAVDTITLTGIVTLLTGKCTGGLITEARHEATGGVASATGATLAKGTGVASL